MKNRWKFKRKLSFLNKYINGTNGVISLFLAILMVPFASIAGVLVNSARINSAVALFDEALCSASNSTLGTYDKFLRERFGLLAMDQNTASHGSGYSVQQLIQDTFKEYMDKNTEVLSNTYDTSTVSATGVYPLADTDVLLSQVYEASKYTVPAKLVIDGFSIEDMIKALTKDLSSVTGIFNTISSSASVVDKVANCDDKFTSLNNKIKSLEESKTNYDNAYNEFKNAVDEYNLLIDEINNKKAEIQKQIDGLNDDISDAEKKFKEEIEKVPELAKQIEDLENEKDADGKPVNNKEKIKKIEEDNKDKLKDYLEAKNNLKDKQDELKGKKDDLNKVEESYSDKLNTKRQNVTDKKNDYSSKIGSYASSVKAAGDAAADAQNSITELQRATNSLITDVSNQMYSSQKKQIDDTIEDYGKKKEKAKNSGDTKTEQYYNDEITKLKDKKTKIDNDYTLDKAVSSSSSAAVSTIKMFSQQDLKSQYSLVYGNLIELKNKVDNDYDIVYGIKKMSETSLYYISGMPDTKNKHKKEKMPKPPKGQVQPGGFAVPGMAGNNGMAVPGMNGQQNFAMPGQQNLNIPTPQNNIQRQNTMSQQQPSQQPQVQAEIQNQQIPQPQQVKQPQPSQPSQPLQQPQPEMQGQQMNFGETTNLDMLMRGGTTVLNSSMRPPDMVSPHLIRIKTNENIMIDKPVFRIGKEKSYVDYFVSDNTAVSRSHANIVSRESKYYVMDTNSTNHTYLNGKMIQSNVEVELAHGDKIRLGNEDFEFMMY